MLPFSIYVFHTHKRKRETGGRGYFFFSVLFLGERGSSVKRIRAFPLPFSLLNNHCIYLDSDFLFIYFSICMTGYMCIMKHN